MAVAEPSASALRSWHVSVVKLVFKGITLLDSSEEDKVH